MLPLYFMNVWKMLLNSLEQGMIFPLLFEKLVSMSNLKHEKITAIWINELAKSLVKTKKVELKGKLENKNNNERNMMERIEKDYPDLKDTFDFKLEKLPNSK